jgi:hypothetical protein
VGSQGVGFNSNIVQQLGNTIRAPLVMGKLRDSSGYTWSLRWLCFSLGDVQVEHLGTCSQVSAISCKPPSVGSPQSVRLASGQTGILKIVSENGNAREYDHQMYGGHV